MISLPSFSSFTSLLQLQSSLQISLSKSPYSELSNSANNLSDQGVLYKSRSRGIGVRLRSPHPRRSQPQAPPHSTQYCIYGHPVSGTQCTTAQPTTVQLTPEQFAALSTAMQPATIQPLFIRATVVIQCPVVPAMEANLAPILLTYVEEDVGPPLNRGDGSRDLDRESWCRERDGKRSKWDLYTIDRQLRGYWRGVPRRYKYFVHTGDSKAYDSDD